MKTQDFIEKRKDELTENILQEIGHGTHGDECSNCITIVDWLDTYTTELVAMVKAELTEEIRRDLQAEKEREMQGFAGITELAKEAAKKTKHT